ncbi:MAG: T9SS type A sorting domain-containing protein [Bacteroidales bacterium]|nr:T9SS type A sorting domain-containing protein [Bacteroidales bacterium]
MKKTLLIAVALCCMMPLMAQKNSEKTTFEQFREKAKKIEQISQMRTTYTERLDSMVYSYGNKMVLVYDPLINCTQVNEYNLDEGVWELARITDYGYDAQNRIISIIETEVGFEEYGSKMTFDYDEQGRVSKEHMFSKIEDDWLEIHYMHHIYGDVNGLEVENHMYGWDDENNIWVEMQKEEYTYFNNLPTLCLYYSSNWETQELELYYQTTWEYDDQNHCTKTESSYWDDENSMWFLESRTEYMYFGNGNLKEEVYSRISYETGEMQYSWRTQYEYDSNNNVTKVIEYNYESEWLLDDTTEIEYDLTVPVGNVAGFSTVLDVSIESYFRNKIVRMTSTDSDGMVEVLDFHYSPCTGVDENTESLMSVWPNPASETLSLKGDMTQVEIFSMDGRLVMSLNSGFESINVSELANGGYLLKASMKDGRVATQIFLKK